MADIIQSASHDYTAASNVESGVGADTIDGNTATSWITYVQQSGGGSKSGLVTSDHTLPGIYTITKVVFKADIQAVTNSGASANRASASALVQVYRAGAWETVAGTSISVSVAGDSNSSDSVDVELSGLSLDGVSQVKATGNTYAQQDGSGGGQWARTKIYLLQAHITAGYAGVL